MMRAEVKFILPNDFATLGENWEAWEPPDRTDVYQWFSIDIGPIGDDAADSFQVAVATPVGVKTKRKRANGRFRGIVVDEWCGAAVRNAIVDYVAAIHADSWEAIVEQLQADFHWEYSRRSVYEYG